MSVLDKWLAVMFIGIAIAGSVSSAAVSYFDSQTAVAAMEHGYVQVVRDGVAIWIKEGGGE